MSRLEKLIQGMATNPRNVRFAEARRVLEAYNWAVDNIVGALHFLERKKAVSAGQTSWWALRLAP